MKAVVVVAQGAELGVLQAIAPFSLPWWSRAFSEGLLWPMDCGPAPYEPSNLTSAFTGVGRGRHGCFSYWRIRGDGGDPPALLESQDVLAPRLWNWDTVGDLRFGVVNVQLTYPPEPISGFMFSYLMNQTLRFTYPRRLAHDLSSRGIRYGHDVSAFYQGEPAPAFFDKVVRIAEYQLEAALALASSVDILVINMTLLDRLSHFLWDAQICTRGRTDSYLLKGYRFIDRALRRLDDVCEGAPLAVFSEIGFGALDRFVSLDRALEAGGLLRIREDGDIDETRSLARESVQGSHGILLLGRASADPVAAEEVRQCLLEAREDNVPLVKTVSSRESVYSGQHLRLAPDLVIEPWDSSRPPMGDPRWARRVNRHLQNGWHRDHGFLITLRANELIHAGAMIRPESIAATVAALVNRDAPHGIEGMAAACSRR
jgi:predicted AlkP superfamily phosphohydrolase/phosphomutase